MGYSACKEGESGGKIGSAIVDGSFGYTRVYPVDSTILFSWMIRDLLNTSFLFLNDSYQRAYLNPEDRGGGAASADMTRSRRTMLTRSVIARTLTRASTGVSQFVEANLLTSSSHGLHLESSMISNPKN